MELESLEMFGILLVLLFLVGMFYFGRVQFFRYLGPASISIRIFMMFFIAGGTLAIGGALADSFGMEVLGMLVNYFLVLGVVIPLVYRNQNRDRLFGYGSRIRNTWYAYLLLALGAPVFTLICISIIKGNQFDLEKEAVYLVMIPAAMVSYSIGLTYQLRKNQRLEAALRKDSRGHALYLRPFALDFAVFNPRILSTTNFPVVPFNGLRDTFEKYFKKTVKKHIGPFVALGSPADRTVVEGASREYFADANWQSEALRLIDDAAVILLQQGKSQNLSWELENLRARPDRLQKMYLLTKPVKGRFYNFIYRFENALRRAPFAGWAEFSSDLNALGYKMPAEYPGDGSVIAFNTIAEAMVLAQGCRRPEHYLSVIENRRRTLAGGASLETPPTYTPGPEHLPFERLLTWRAAQWVLAPVLLLGSMAGGLDIYFHYRWQGYETELQQEAPVVTEQIAASADDLPPQNAEPAQAPADPVYSSTESEQAREVVVEERPTPARTRSDLTPTPEARESPRSEPNPSATTKEQRQQVSPRMTEQTAKNLVFATARNRGWTGKAKDVFTDGDKPAYQMTLLAGASDDILLADYPVFPCSSHLRFRKAEQTGERTVDLTFIESLQVNKENCEDGLTVHIYVNLDKPTVIGIKYFHPTLGMASYGTLTAQ
ncbi:MAG: hypothetical protein IPH12_07030 [Saprospirales bacterium]|nr:hypothetical protein [Saprospirales bacterium]